MNHRDDEQLAFTVATVWREERVSCPHPDILHAYESGALTVGAREFLAFHLGESACPYCNSVLEDLRARQRDADEVRLSDLKDRLMRSTVSELRRKTGA
jgi:hypothetical protein